MPHLYEPKSYDPKRNAQLNLAGRTHYVDDSTLKYFHARILSTHIVDSGLLFALIESASGDYEHKTRVFRHVIFDVFGHVVERPSIEGAFKSAAPARKAMWKALDRIDAKAVTLAAIERETAAHAREMAELAARVAAIQEKAAA